jgi:hypothetical protein
MMGQAKNQFSLTRAALGASERAKSKFNRTQTNIAASFVSRHPGIVLD